MLLKCYFALLINYFFSTKNKNTIVCELKEYIDQRNSFQICKCKLWKSLTSVFGLILKDGKWLFLWPVRCIIVLALSKSLQLAPFFQVAQKSFRTSGYPFSFEVWGGTNPTGHKNCSAKVRALSVCLQKFWKNYIQVPPWESTLHSRLPAH